MDSITLTFPEPIQVSVQIGDTAYFTNDINGVDIKEIGIITAIDYSTNSITCNIPPTAERPLTTSFILFSKTSEANTNSLTGYYLYSQLRNNSEDYAEIFSVGTEIFESSK
tara:strand:+ start:509 stop:841 length:333 start_codon:yes stop_codon:yes gene_type:complete